MFVVRWRLVDDEAGRMLLGLGVFTMLKGKMIDGFLSIG